MKTISWIAALATACSMLGCFSPKSPSDAQGPSPLGRSYILVPLPSDDQSLLGRMLRKAPDVDRALEEQTVANPCGNKLSPVKLSPTVNYFEAAKELRVGGKVSATLALFGFDADAGTATHFVYKLTTEKRASRMDTEEYNACCEKKGCGYGYVSALIYGKGEYASASESSASIGATYVVASAKGSLSMKAHSKRQVQGWIAAVVSRDPASTNCPAGKVWGEFECVTRQDIKKYTEDCARTGTAAWEHAFPPFLNPKSFKEIGCEWLDDHGLR